MTTRRPPEYYLPIWEQAQEEELGLLIKVEPEDQTLLINALYDCRKAVGGFDDLIIMSPQPAGTVYVMKKTTEVVE